MTRRTASCAPRRSAVRARRPAQPRRAARQRGVAALLITTLLFFALVLTLAYTQRNLIAEQRMSADQVRSTRAFEAAEAGLEWVLAGVNDNRRTGADCLPSDDPSATSLRDRMLRHDDATGTLVPVSRDVGAPIAPALPGSAAAGSGAAALAASALEAACVRHAEGWTCSCPAQGRPHVTDADGDASAPAFRVRFAPGRRDGSAQVGIVRVVSTGCSGAASVCADAASNRLATATVEVALGLLPGLRSAPAAPLTVRGGVDADGSAWSAQHADPQSGGLAVHAGAAIAASHAHLSGPPGAGLATITVDRDARLGALTRDRFFAALFGVDEARWAAQPALTHVDCHGDCGAALSNAIGVSGANVLIDIGGDATLAGPLVLGTPLRPVVIVAHGDVRLSGAITVNGVLRGASLSWSRASGDGGSVHGAAIADTGYRGDGTPDFVYDAAILARLQTRSGSFARLSGSWRDF